MAFENLALSFEYLKTSVGLRAASNRMQYVVKKGIREGQKQQKNRLDEIWDNNKECRFDVQDELEKKLETYKNKGLPASFKESATIKKSNRLVAYTLWYTTSSNPRKIENLTKAEKEFVNAVAYELDRPRVYEDEAIADLKFYDVDGTFMMDNPAFVTSIKRIKERKTDNFTVKADEALKKQEEAAEKPEIVQEDKPVEIITPFRVTPNNTWLPGQENEVVQEMEVNKKGNLGDAAFAYLEKYIAPIFKDTPFKYSYFKNVDKSITLNVIGINESKSYIIDTGSLFGSSNYALIYPAVGYDGLVNNQPISIKDRTMMESILVNPFIVPEYNKVMESVNKYAFSLGCIHQMFDMSSIDLDQLSKNDKTMLGDKLLKIHNIIKVTCVDKEDGRLPRFRIITFNNPDNFSFISDENVNTSLVNVGGHYDKIMTGVSGAIKGNTFTLYRGGEPQLYNLNDATWES